MTVTIDAIRHMRGEKQREERETFVRSVIAGPALPPDVADRINRDAVLSMWENAMLGANMARRQGDRPKAARLLVLAGAARSAVTRVPAIGRLLPHENLVSRVSAEHTHAEYRVLYREDGARCTTYCPGEGRESRRKLRDESLARWADAFPGVPYPHMDGSTR